MVTITLSAVKPNAVHPRARPVRLFPRPSEPGAFGLGELGEKHLPVSVSSTPRPDSLDRWESKFYSRHVCRG
jgi:hypothetical protein